MHTYATLAQFQDYLRDGGSADLGNGNARTLVSFLEAASRRVDAYCERTSATGASAITGFGPRIGTNLYDGHGEQVLNLEDDLVSTTAITRADYTGGPPVALVADTDYYLEPYGRAPYRNLRLNGLGAGTASGYRIWSVMGTWAGPGWGTLVADATVSSGLTITTTQTAFILSASPDVSPGNTLLIGSEQLYLSALNGTTVTVVRGANGTTAATHADASAISVYTYHPSVVDATLQIAARRMRSSQAGLSGEFGGIQMPGAPQRDSEWSVLNATVGQFHFISIS